MNKIAVSYDVSPQTIELADEVIFYGFEANKEDVLEFAHKYPNKDIIILGIKPKEWHNEVSKIEHIKAIYNYCFGTYFTDNFDNLNNTEAFFIELGEMNHSAKDLGYLRPEKIYLSPAAHFNSVYSWILPQHMKFYPENIILDFSRETPTRQEALVRIYKSGKYEGDISFLLDNDLHVDARLLEDKFGERRANCRMKCRFPSENCKFCEKYIKLKQVIQKVDKGEL